MRRWASVLFLNAAGALLAWLALQGYRTGVAPPLKFR
jgi:hypothetical protein